jgi:hypothetical protein
MKKNANHHRFLILITIALSLCLLPLSSTAAIPQTITYQGYLTNPQGTAIDDTITIHFFLYSTSSGGTPLWTETHTITVTDGVFSTNLGTTTPITLPFDTQYYLEITVGSDSEMTPRQPLTSVAYAFRAQEADSVKDDAVTTTVIANNAVTTEKIATDAITGDKIANIANGAVGSTQIGNNTITSQDLADNAVTAAKIKPPIISSIDGVNNDGGNVDLVAGSNVTITPDDAANTITIASTGGVGSSPWTESGGNVYRDSGNVGIGTTTLQEKLHVEGNIRIPNNSSIKNAYGNEIFHTGWDSQFGDYTGIKSGYAWDKSGEPISVVIGEYGVFFTKGDELGNPHAETLMKINTKSGNVGIGTTDPQSKLHVDGIVLAENFGGPSDECLKSEVRQITDALEKLGQIRGVTFKWNEKAKSLGATNGEKQIGVIAQEVETVFPELVFTSDNGLKSVYYTKLTAVLIEAVKEQQETIKELNARIADLERDKN